MVSDPPPRRHRAVSPVTGGGPLSIPVPFFGVHGLLPQQRFWIDWGHIFQKKPKPTVTLARFWNVRRCSSFFRGPWKWLLPTADPAIRRHRLVGCLEAHALASALGSARIGQPSTLSDNRWSRWQVSQSSRNSPGSKRFEDRDCVREGCVPLSTRPLVVFVCAKSLACPSDTAHARNQNTARAYTMMPHITASTEHSHTRRHARKHEPYSTRNASACEMLPSKSRRPQRPSDPMETRCHLQGTSANTSHVWT